MTEALTPRDERPRATGRVFLALALLTVAALALRWPAVHRLLPQLPEPDAFLVMHAQQMRGDPDVLTKQEFDERYPTLVTRVLRALPRSSVDPSLSSGEFERRALAAAAQPYAQGRVVVLVFSILLVPLTFLAARRFLGPRAALVGAFLVATSLLHALFSTQARPHGAHASLALLAVFLALRVVERPSVGRVVAATVGASLSIACLQSGLFTLPPLAAALVLAPGSRLARWVRGAFVPLAAFGAALWAYPVLPSIDAHGVHMGGAGSHDVLFSSFNLSGVAVAARWLAGHDPMLGGLALVGAVFGGAWVVRHRGAVARGERRALLVVAAYVLPYASLIAVSEEIYERFLLPLLPWIAIVAAFGLARLVAASGPNRALQRARPAILAASALALAVPVVVLASFARVSAAPDTIRQAADWMRANPDAARGRWLASPYLAPPVVFGRASLDAAGADNAALDNVWIVWQRTHPSAGSGLAIDMFPAALANAKDDLTRVDRWIEDRVPDWILVRVSRQTNGIPALRRMREWAETHGELAWQSSGTAPRALEIGLADYQAVEDMARRILETDAFGPLVEIWRIRR